MVGKTKEDAEETRAKILRAAYELFADNGFASTSIADICDAADLTKGALFYHFASKEILFETIWLNLQMRMDDETRKVAIATAKRTDDPYAIFLAGCRTFLEHVSETDFQRIVNIDGPAVLGMERWSKYDREMGLRNIGSGLKQLASKGLIEEDNRRALTVILYGALQGIAQTLSRRDSQLNGEQMFAAFEHVVRSIK